MRFCFQVNKLDQEFYFLLILSNGYSSFYWFITLDFSRWIWVTHWTTSCFSKVLWVFKLRQKREQSISWNCELRRECQGRKLVLLTWDVITVQVLFPRTWWKFSTFFFFYNLFPHPFFFFIIFKSFYTASWLQETSEWTVPPLIRDSFSMVISSSRYKFFPKYYWFGMIWWFCYNGFVQIMLCTQCHVLIIQWGYLNFSSYFGCWMLCFIVSVMTFLLKNKIFSLNSNNFGKLVNFLQ